MQGSYTFVSLNSKLGSNQEEEGPSIAALSFAWKNQPSEVGRIEDEAGAAFPTFASKSKLSGIKMGKPRP